MQLRYLSVNYARIHACPKVSRSPSNERKNAIKLVFTERDLVFIYDSIPFKQVVPASFPVCYKFPNPILTLWIIVVLVSML